MALLPILVLVIGAYTLIGFAVAAWSRRKLFGDFVISTARGPLNALGAAGFRDPRPALAAIMGVVWPITVGAYVTLKIAGPVLQRRLMVAEEGPSIGATWSGDAIKGCDCQKHRQRAHAIEATYGLGPAAAFAGTLLGQFVHRLYRTPGCDAATIRPYLLEIVKSIQLGFKGHEDAHAEHVERLRASREAAPDAFAHALGVMADWADVVMELLFIVYWDVEMPEGASGDEALIRGISALVEWCDNLVDCAAPCTAGFEPSAEVAA